ncbi:MAG: hypothetical protein M0P23_05530 [Bacteroidales bacterium]|jgi:alpha-L-rhamnosidase|nr:hypothetical protein [Bacteroidales bacterium]NLB03566.1 hypothetical protein [Bacteroidales bacterium]
MPKYRKFIFSLLLTGLFCACQSPVIESLKLENLRLDSYEKEGARQVSLSWTMNAMTPRGINQEAYRILIASRPELLEKNAADLWDSGKVSAAKSYNIPYLGRPLQSDSSYYAKIMLWTNQGRSPWSETQNLVLPADRQVFSEPETVNRFDTYDLKLSNLVEAYKKATLEKYKKQTEVFVNMEAGQSWAESYMLDNRKLYLQWMDQIAAAQDEEGCLPMSVQIQPQAFLEVAQMLYRQYDETSQLKKHYSVMEKWLAYLWNNYGSDDYIMTANREAHYMLPAEEYSLNGKIYSTSAALISTAIFYRMCVIMEGFSTGLNYPDKTIYYADWADNLREAYNKQFYNSENQHYENNTLTANLVSLSLGLCEEKQAEKVFRHIEQSVAIEHKGKAACGDLGKQYLYRTLSAWGRADLTYRLASELKEVEGDFILWFFEHLCGLKSLESGFSHFSLDAVFPPGIYFAKTRMETRNGAISSSWIKTADDFVWQVIVPVNTKARFRYPAADIKDIYDDGRLIDQVEGVHILGLENGNVIMELVSGDYYFSGKLARIKPGIRKIKE